MKMNKKHFEFFKKECKKWIDKFELNDWKVYFHFGNGKEDTFSSIRIKLDGRVASIYFNEDWYDGDDEPICNKLKQTAKHEIIHLMLARFSEIAHARYISDSEAYEAEEELVRKLENLL